jgi:hypothetical protein
MIQGDSVEYDLLAKWADFDCNGIIRVRLEYVMVWDLKS